MAKSVEIEIEICEPKKKKATDLHTIHVTERGISIGAQAASRLNVRDGDYILIGFFGDTMLLAKRPVGLPGYKLWKTKSKNKDAIQRLNCQCKEAQAKAQGTHELGESVTTKQKTAEGVKEVTWIKTLRLQ